MSAIFHGKWCAPAAGAALLLAIAWVAAPAHALRGGCSQPLTNGIKPSATDCLFILRVAVETETCNPSCICAPKGSLPTSASDALICLKSATGQAVNLDCRCQPVTTTSTSTSTSSSSTSSTLLLTETTAAE